MQWFFKLHRNLPREGPGNDASTARAFDLIQELPPQPRILDIGCGPGKQTLILAQRSGGQVTAVDMYAPFLAQLARRSREAGLEGLIHPQRGDMFTLDFADGSFDLLWSEGAIYILGFERGLREWKRLLKPGGSLAVTELSWLVEDPPAEAYAFWQRDYPAMKSVPENLAIIAQCGYTLTGHFTLPQSAWWDEYYAPLERRARRMRARYEKDAEAQAVLAVHAQEVEMYRKYADAYGYEFYVMRKPEN